MKQASSFTQRRPVTAIFLTSIAIVLLLAASGTVLYLLNGGPSKGWSAQFQPVAVGFPFVAIWLTIQIFRSNLQSLLSLETLPSLQGTAKWLFLPPAISLVVQAFEVAPDLSVGLTRIILSACLALLVGYVEEGIYRGLFMHWLMPRGLQVAVWGSTLVFALTHAVNALGAQTISLTLLQICFAGIFGYVAAQLRVATSTLVPLICWHAMFDMIGFLGEKENIHFLVLNCMFLAAYGGYLSYRNKGEIPPFLEHAKSRG